MEHETFLSKVNELSNLISEKLERRKDEERIYKEKFDELNNSVKEILNKFDICGWEIGYEDARISIGIEGIQSNKTLTDKEFGIIRTSVLTRLDAYYRNI